MESEVVLRLKVQFVVPDAEEKAPPSICTWTELKLTASEAKPEMVIVPETVDPLPGEEMLNEGGCAALTVRVAALLVILRAVLPTTTVNCAPLSELLVAGVV